MDFFQFFYLLKKVFSFKNWSSLSHRILRLAAVVTLFGSDIIFVAIYCFYYNNKDPKISISAHLSGGVAGFFCGLSIFRKIKINSII